MGFLPVILMGAYSYDETEKDHYRLILKNNYRYELHVINSSHEKAPEDLWGEPMDVVKGRVGLLVTLPLPWVGGRDRKSVV